MLKSPNRKYTDSTNQNLSLLNFFDLDQSLRVYSLLKTVTFYLKKNNHIFANF